MSTKFLSPGWRMPRNANQSKSSNYSMDLNGSSQYIDSNFIPANNLTGNFTISAWVYSDSIGGGIGVDFICGVENYTTPRKKFGFGLYNNNSPQYYYMFGATSAIGATISNNPKNAWTHLTVTYDGTNLNFYSNGTLDDTVNVGALSDYSTSNMYIGARNKVDPGDNAEDFFNGKMAELCIFNYALSQSQVTTLWGGGTSVSNPMALPSPPIAYYPLGTSAWNGEYLSENNAIGDYVFDFIPSDYIDCGTGLGNTLGSSVSDMTVSLWYKNQTGSNEGLFTIMSSITSETTAPFAISYSNTNNSIYVWFGSTDYNYYSRTLDSNWHHLSIVKNGTSLTTYIDGSSVSPSGTVGSIPATIDTTNKKTFIGVYYSDSFTYNGSLSNAQVFNTALSSTDIETLYNYGSPIRTLANIPQSSNLKAWYKLDATEIYNSTSTEWSVDNNKYPSAYQSSLNFANGANNKITITPAGSPTYSAYSVSVWINPTTFAGDYARIFQFTTNNRFFGLRSTGAIVSGFEPWAGNELTTTAVLSTNRWYHLVFVDNGTNTIVYIDKVGETLNTSSSTGGSNWYIGNNANDRLNSKLSNVQVFNTALSQSDVNTLYNNGTPLTDMSSFSSLVSWYKLNNTTTGIQDSKGSNNGTNQGATEYAGFVNVLAGDSSGMSQSNLVQSDLQTVAPYSKYAMSFDGTDYIEVDSTPILNGATSLSISAWCKIDNNVEEPICSLWVSAGNQQYLLRSNTSYGIQFYLRGSWGMQSEGTNQALTPGQWYHIVATWDGSFIYIYVNGSLAITPKAASGTLDTMTGQKDWIGRHSANYLDGNLSNVAYWRNTALNQSQVREIYNEGLPSNLHNFSGTAPTAWWQLGENSSFASNWICADEKGTNNGEGQNMGVDALTNGVGTTANGVSTNMSEDNLVGDAPYSTANALSTNMVITSRVSGVSDAAITTGGTGYVTGTNIATTGGSGTNCTINITTVSGGVITAITINNGGSNYVIGDVLTISGGNGNATITVSGLNTP